MENPTTVFCAADFSAGSDEAIRQADRWARELRVGLVVCHVLPSPLHSHPVLAQGLSVDYARLPEIQHQILDALGDRVEALTGREDADLVVEVAETAVYATLVERAEAARAELVVVGSATGPDADLGEVAEQVVRYAHAPVLVARPGAGTGPVVAATDLSDPALPAVVAAARVASRRGVPLEVVHAFHLPIEPVAIPEAVMFLPAPTEQQRGELRELARQRLLGELARCQIAAQPVLLDGPVASLVLERLREVSASLLVVATRGRTGLSRVLLGSTAEALVRGARCPVLAVRLAPRPSAAAPPVGGEA